MGSCLGTSERDEIKAKRRELVLQSADETQGWSRPPCPGIVEVLFCPVFRELCFSGSHKILLVIGFSNASSNSFIFFPVERKTNGVLTPTSAHIPPGIFLKPGLD